MKTYQVVKLGDVLKRNTKQIRIEDNQKYKQVTVRLWGKGVQLRNEVYGHEIKSDSRYIVKSGQFIISKIDARNGASGLIPEELDGAVTTGDFLSFDINKDLILPEYLLWLSRTEWFIEQCAQASSGTTNRIRLNESKFLQIDFFLPNISEQAQIIRKIQDAVQIINNIDLVLTEQKQLTEILRQSILQKAIQGHLVEQDPNDEPVAELLKRIWEEKERQTKEKKIKKEKPLPPISPEEIPYELPKGWEWVRLGDISLQITDGAHHTPTYVSEGVPFLSVKDMSNGYLDFSDVKYISLEEHQQLIQRSKPEFGDILLTKIGTTGIAKVVDTDREFSIFVSLALIKLFKEHVLPNYIEHVLNSPLVRKQSEEGTEGVGNKNLVLKKIKNFLLPLPPLNEQKRIVRKIDYLLDITNRLNDQIGESRKKQEILFNAVLQKAFQIN